MSGVLGTVIAVRQLAIAGAPEASVRVRLGKPRKDRATGDYFCPFVIQGLGKEEVQQAWGIDSMQALQSAMQAIRFALAPHAKKLAWVGSPADGLGFPMTIPELFGTKFSRRLEGLVERETNRFGRALERAHKQRAAKGRGQARKRKA